MKRIIFGIGILLFFGTLVFAEEKQAGGEEQAEKIDEVTAAEIADILQEINQNLQKITGDFDMDKRRKDDGPAPDFGFGGAPYWPVRILFDMDKMNGYVRGIGSYEAFPEVIVPFRDGGGGTWRWMFNKYAQMGMNYFGAGFSSRGQQHHAQPTSDLATNYPVYGVITVDENGDKLDDYYTYASYSFFYWSMLFQGKLPLHKRFNLVAGAQIGFGSEAFAITRNDRTTGPLSGALGIMNGDSNWERSYLVTGGWLGAQINVDNKNIFKLGLDVGFDYNIPFEKNWSPTAGTHVAEAAPPYNFNAMNLWITFGPQFHF